MPDRLRVHTDNATSEGKNQWIMKALSTMVSRDIVAQGLMTMFRVGHTHFKVDQRFSEIRTLLASADELQTPQAYQDFLLKNLKPREGRALHVEILSAARDFKSWLEPIPINVA